MFCDRQCNDSHICKILMMDNSNTRNVFEAILNALKNLYLQYLQGNHNLSQKNKRNILGWSFSIHLKRFFITKENLNGTCLYMVIDPTNIKEM